uniref:Uncharacterized protein n=1 Tax=Ananas comosus var. bracteatus TaxID=296719 RepID=A0A6V7QAY8_ANACO|nr:unnamed protein product [Ananas comosus var. bracteatus]
MPSSSYSSLPFLVLLLLSAAASAPPAEAAAAAMAAPPPSNGSTVYDLLPEFGLPPGLLPDSVTSFSLASDGSFVVDIAGPCYVDFEYLVYYEPRVTAWSRSYASTSSRPSTPAAPIAPSSSSAEPSPPPRSGLGAFSLNFSEWRSLEDMHMWIPGKSFQILIRTICMLVTE